MNQLKAVIFDVDGTLAATERDGHRIAFNRAFAEAGLDWHWDDQLYGKLLAITGGRERIQYYLENFHLQCGFAGDHSDMVSKLHTAKNRHYIEILETQSIPLRLGVKRLLSEIRESGVRLAIATTSVPDNVMTLIKTTLGEAALDWFECIAAGDVVPSKKPSPDIYHYCLQQLQLNPSQCLAVEDSANGLSAAYRAGIATLVTINAYTAEEDFDQAICVVDHLGEPGIPTKVLAGLSINNHYITLQSLQDLHAQIN